MTILDTDVRKLQQLEERGFKAKTIVAYDFNIAKAIKFADVLVGAVLIPGARAACGHPRDGAHDKPRSLIMDISIDQGGCIETSRPATENPTYIEENVIHYCVPNMTGVVARTTTTRSTTRPGPTSCRISRSTDWRALLQRNPPCATA